MGGREGGRKGREEGKKLEYRQRYPGGAMVLLGTSRSRLPEGTALAGWLARSLRFLVVVFPTW